MKTFVELRDIFATDAAELTFPTTAMAVGHCISAAIA
jgi:hypothetical protein